MGADARKSPRKRVHFRVAYKRGDALIEKYADNLSAGGLFVCDAEGLAPRERVQIEMELPRPHGVYRVNAEVMHVIPPNDPQRRAGAGLKLDSPPSVFVHELAAYLQRLENRKTASVYVDAEPWRRVFAEAGYRVLALPPPTALVQVLGDGSAIAILAFDEMVEPYRNALAFLGQDESFVVPIAEGQAVEPVLAHVDDRLLGNSSMTPAQS